MLHHDRIDDSEAIDTNKIKPSMKRYYKDNKERSQNMARDRYGGFCT